MNEEIIFLDLNKVDLYGWENGKSDLVIDAIIRGIEAGDVFDPVSVRKRSDTEYELALRYFDENNYGGHHRAVAHFIANAPLKCKVVHYRLYNRRGYINIKDIRIVDDAGEYGQLKKISFYR